MSHLFFVSYSRINVKYPKDAELVQQLVSDLTADLDQALPPRTADDVCFFDTTNIETGSDWNEDLSDAAGRSRVAVSLYSPSYFSSVWCGREFQVFLDRRRQAPVNPGERGPRSIVPVIWMRHTGLPEQAAAIQNVDAAFPKAPFPPEYQGIGLRQIMLLKAEPQYTQVRLALGERILAAVTAAPLPEIPDLDLRNYRSAWAGPVGGRPGSATLDSVTRTCFVFLANDGEHWRPYAEPEPRIGALARQIMGEIGLQYEEIPCDAGLHVKLSEANKRHVPTLLFCDPSSWTNPGIQQAMEQYDNRYYLNCGLIVPWNVSSPAGDPRWRQLSEAVCPQKTRVPPVNHEWTSVSTPATLKNKTLATVEEIRGRMLNELAASGEKINKVENQAVTDAAQAIGIAIRSAPVISNTLKTETP